MSLPQSILLLLLEVIQRTDSSYSEISVMDIVFFLFSFYYRVDGKVAASVTSSPLVLVRILPLQCFPAFALSAFYFRQHIDKI